MVVVAVSLLLLSTVVVVVVGLASSSVVDTVAVGSGCFSEAVEVVLVAVGLTSMVDSALLEFS